MLNVGKPIQTPDDVLLVEVDEDQPDKSTSDDFDLELEPGADDEFSAQDRLLSELGVDRQTVNSDGSVEVSFGDDDKPTESTGDFNENLAEVFDDTTLDALALECLDVLREDINSRADWEK